MSELNRLSRKSFFQNFFSALRELSQIDGKQRMFVLLPPGIASEDAFLQHCNECHKCVAQCPHLALRVHRQENNAFYGKPVIIPQEQPCYLCNDLPCVKACETGALQMEFSSHLNGIAQIDATRCLAFDGLFCRACVNACPLMDEAIFINSAGLPQINAEKCTGCGICEYQCSLEQPAIKITFKVGKE